MRIQIREGLTIWDELDSDKEVEFELQDATTFTSIYINEEEAKKVVLILSRMFNIGEKV